MHARVGWKGVIMPVMAVSLALSTVPGMAAGVVKVGGDDPPPPPNTLTKAPYMQTNGNRGVINLLTPGKGTAAEVPGKEPIIVSLGDSYISGEAGRWAGNSSGKNWASYSDALGSTAYGDNNGVESLPQCHRSKEAEINIGGGVTSVNLACSGATTFTDASSKPFKPGIDFTNTTIGANKAVAFGQALLLQNLAKSNPGRVKMVVLSIGGNDFDFEPIVSACVESFLTWIIEDACSQQKAITDHFSPQNVATQQAAIAGAIGNVIKAMTQAGYKSGQWNLVVQTYPSPLATSDNIIWWQNLLRQSLGGCGMWNEDLDWAYKTALPTINAAVKGAVGGMRGSPNAPNLQILDLSKALMGHRLCERGTTIVGKWPPFGNWAAVKDWKQSNAVDLSEWVNQIRVASRVSPEGNKPYELQESLHPNYWGQLAYQNCLTQVYGDGKNVTGGTCVLAGPGLDKKGRPPMELDKADGWDVGLGELPNKSSAKGPGAVRGLQVSKVKNEVVSISWRKPNDGEVRLYHYRLRKDDQPWYGWTQAGESNKVVITLPAAKHYRVQVVASNSLGSGDRSQAGFSIWPPL